jgi:hypothetical protein
VTAWKKQLLSQAAGLFEDGRRRPGDSNHAAQEVELFEQDQRCASVPAA